MLGDEHRNPWVGCKWSRREPTYANDGIMLQTSELLSPNSQAKQKESSAEFSLQLTKHRNRRVGCKESFVRKRQIELLLKKNRYAWVQVPPLETLRLSRVAKLVKAAVPKSLFQLFSLQAFFPRNSKKSLL